MIEFYYYSLRQLFKLHSLLISSHIRFLMTSTKEAPKSNEGLGGIVAGDSVISTVGIGLGLNYRGYNIVDLAEHCIFE